MDIQIQPASPDEQDLLRQLMELYLYDFSEFDSADTDEQGLYGYRYLDRYWAEPERHPLIVHVDGKPAGFVLVRQIDPGPPPTHSIAEFFVMRKYRLKGVGCRVAQHVFDLFPGYWHVAQEAANLPAQAFWRRVISDYTGGHLQEVIMDNDEWRGPVQTFSARSLG